MHQQIWFKNLSGEVVPYSFHHNKICMPKIANICTVAQNSSSQKCFWWDTGCNHISLMRTSYCVFHQHIIQSRLYDELQTWFKTKHSMLKYMFSEMSCIIYRYNEIIEMTPFSTTRTKPPPLYLPALKIEIWVWFGRYVHISRQYAEVHAILRWASLHIFIQSAKFQNWYQRMSLQIL